LYLGIGELSLERLDLIRLHNSLWFQRNTQTAATVTQHPDIHCFYEADPKNVCLALITVMVVMKVIHYMVAHDTGVDSG